MTPFEERILDGTVAYNLVYGSSVPASVAYAFIRHDRSVDTVQKYNESVRRQQRWQHWQVGLN